MIDLRSSSDRFRLRHLARGVGTSPERETAVRQMVREQLQRPRRPSDAALYGRAVRIDPGIRALGVREFLDGYVRPEIQRRKRARPEGGRGGSSKSRRPGAPYGRRGRASERRAETARRMVRETLVQVAREAAAADSVAAVIDLLDSIDRHAERLADRLEALA